VNSVLLIDTEQVFVTAVSGSNPYNCTVTRGYASSAASHSAGALVQGAITATHHNALAAEIQAIEATLGANPGVWAAGASLIYYTGGRVGIGYATPGEKLEIRDTAYPYLRIGRSDAVNYVRFGIESNYAALWIYGPNQLQIQNATASTGVTTVNVAAGAGQATAHLMNWNDNTGNNQAYITANGNLVATMVTANATGGGVGYVRLQPGTATATGYIEFRNASGTRFGYIGNDTANFTLNLENGASFLVSGGSMGIGTTPGYLLDVQGAQYNLIRARSTGSNTAAIMLDVASSGQQTNLTFADAGTNKWTLAKGNDNSFFLYDWARGANAITIASNGSMSLMPNGGDVRVGKSNSLSGTLTVMDATPTTGVTRFIVKAGAANVSSGVPAMALYSDWITNGAQLNLFSISANQQVSLALYGATNAIGWIIGRDYASAGSNEFFFYNLSLAKFTTFIDSASGNFCIAGGATPTNVAGGGGYNSQHLCLGAYHIWVDGSGRLRIKAAAPTSDADGAVVGAQS
jgi:hypothetical protein